MNARDSSPRRRHILASINQETESRHDHRKRRSPSVKDDDAAPASDANASAGHDGERKHRSKRLKLKDPKRHRPSGRERHEERHSHRRRRRHRSRSPTPPNPFEPEPLDAETAFRESLFDAMADDEGASYWHEVYGQPVHVYTNEKLGPQGELEKMTDDEYAAYVRRKMWEKTQEGMEEERERLREERRRAAKLEKEARRKDREARRVREEIEESLRRGQERKMKSEWSSAWDRYLKTWAEWEAATDKSALKIPWPVKSKTRADVDESSVRAFFETGLDRNQTGDREFSRKIKEERVRWHPDRFQRQMGGEVDPDIIKTVTMVFQVADTLWNDTRRKE